MPEEGEVRKEKVNMEELFAKLATLNPPEYVVTEGHKNTERESKEVLRRFAKFYTLYGKSSLSIRIKQAEGGRIDVIDPKGEINEALSNDYLKIILENMIEMKKITNALGVDVSTELIEKVISRLQDKIK